MRLAPILRLRLRSLLAPATVESELDEELRYHLEREIESNLAAGMDRAEARSAALRSIAGLEQRKEECRDMRGLNLFDNLRKDLRFALRQLRKNSGFTATAILVLALGISASVAIFAFVDAALIKPLPYRDPARLVGVYETIPSCPLCNLSYPDYLDWKQRNQVFSAFDIYNGTGFKLNTPTGPQPAAGVRVTSGFLHTLGVTPILGHDFVAGDNLPASPHTVLLSYGVWQQRYAGKSNVLGQVVMLDGQPYTVIGVLPREFHFALVGTAEFWTAFQPSNGCDLRRSCHGLYGVARLKDGVSVQAALSGVQTIARQLMREYPDSNRDQDGTVAPLTEVIVGNIRPMLIALLSGAGLLLLIASVNVAGLLVVRSESRRREIAVRTALGASAGRLICQFVTEAVVLVMAGSALGLSSAHWAIQILRGLISRSMMDRMPFLLELGLNGHTLAMAGVVAVMAVLLLSLPPGLGVWSRRISGGLAEGSRGSAGSTWRRLGSRLVVIELATAMVLLSGAGLLGKSLHRLLHVPIGLQPNRLATLEVSVPLPTNATDAKAIAVANQIVDSVRALPGVKSVGFASQGAPLGGNGNTTWIRVLGRPWHGEHNEVPEREVSPGYFQTLGARLSRGRFFSESEDTSKPRVAIVNQAFVNRYFPGEDPLGKQLSYLSAKPVPMEVVGIVDDIREGPLDAAIPPVLYLPFNQNTSDYFSLMVRTSSDGAVLPAIVAAIRRIDPGIVSLRGATMNERINDSPSAYLHRSLAWLVGGFAVLALLLGVVGLYGVIAYSVSQRSREIGIRMALGAQVRSVYGLVLREACWLAALGIGAGMVASIAAASLIRDLLFGVSSWDVSTLAGVAAVLGTAAILASFIPAHRAASVNPVDALRSE